MSLLTRLRYAPYLAVVGGAAVALLMAIASADAVALLPISAFDALFGPFFVLAVYGVSFALAPWVVRRLPIKQGGNESGV